MNEGGPTGRLALLRSSHPSEVATAYRAPNCATVARQASRQDACELAYCWALRIRQRRRGTDDVAGTLLEGLARGPLPPIHEGPPCSAGEAHHAVVRTCSGVRPLQLAHRLRDRLCASDAGHRI